LPSLRSAPVARDRPVIPGFAIGETQYEELIDTHRRLNGSDLAPPARNGLGLRRTDSGGHSSGIPALRRPAK
jgi:hypothetical protein